MKLHDKTIVVTGGGNGIGRELVLELLRRGARVAAVDVRQESLDETRSLAGADAVGPGALADDRLADFVVDIIDRGAVEALPDQVNSRLGPTDGLINNAGIIQPFQRFNDLDYADIGRVVNVNLWGVIHMTKTFLPTLLQRPEAHLTNVSSMGGFLPVPGQTVYGATKAAVKLLTEGLYAELLETGVGVSVVMPGGVSTDITTNSGVAAPVDAESAEGSRLPTTTPSKAASIILDGMESDTLHIFVGKDAKAMNMATKVAPKQATHFIYKQMKNLLD